MNQALLLLTLAGSLLVLSACQSDANLKAGATGEGTVNLSSSPLLSEYRGDVTVLLMGSPGCPGSQEANRILKKYDQSKPDGVSIVRVEVPPPGGSMTLPDGWNPGIPSLVDHDRQAAEAFDFYYYPTLYIFDRDGDLRFKGDCEEGPVVDVVGALTAEKPGAEKRSFNKALPAAGEAAAAFSASTLEGKRVSLADLAGDKATLLVFGSITCPYSKKAMVCVPRLKDDYAPKGVTVAIINAGGTAAEVGPFYGSTTPEVTVVVDSSSNISSKKYGVNTVPFFYVLDGEGKIAYRMAFNEETAREAIEAVLGLSAKPVKPRSGGAG